MSKLRNFETRFQARDTWCMATCNLRIPVDTPQGVNKISLHFWMIQTMFKNKFKKVGNGAQIGRWENPHIFF